MTTVSNKATTLNVNALALNTLVTILVTVIISGLAITNNQLGLTSPIDLSLHFGSLVLGVALFSKTSVDGVLLMTQIISKSNTQLQVGAAVAATTLVNGIAVALIGGIWLIVEDCPWLVYTIIIVASLYLLKLAKEGLDALSDDKHHDALITDTDQIAEYDGKTPLEVGTITALQLALLYGDGAAANMELLTKVNFWSLTCGMLIGQFILATVVLLVPKEQVDGIAENDLFHKAGIAAFVLLALYGFYEAGEGIWHNYGSVLQSLLG
jgi:hypothetical protein